MVFFRLESEMIPNGFDNKFKNRITHLMRINWCLPCRNSFYKRDFKRLKLKILKKYSSMHKQ